jgi:hypothetical protein
MLDAGDLQELGAVALSRIVIGAAEGDHEAFSQGLDDIETSWEALGWDLETVIKGFVAVVEGALELGDHDIATEWLKRFDAADPAWATNYLRASAPGSRAGRR